MSFRQRFSNIIPCPQCGVGIGEPCKLLSSPVIGPTRRWGLEDATNPTSLVNHPQRNKLFNELAAESGLTPYRLHQKVARTQQRQGLY